MIKRLYARWLLYSGGYCWRHPEQRGSSRWYTCPLCQHIDIQKRLKKKDWATKVLQG